MSDFTEILDLVDIRREYFISDITIRSSDQVIVLYVPTERVSKKVKNGFVSEKQLRNLAKKLTEKYSLEVEFIYVQTNKLEKLEQGIEMLLRAKYSDIVEDANFTFLNASHVNVWIKPKNLEKNQKSSVESYLSAVFNENDVSSIDFQWVDEIDELPSFVEILVMTKKHQPILLKRYVSNFSSDYQHINEKWLNRQLDKLIKRDLVVRDNITKEYSLTWKGLGAIPNVLSRTSSDIARALDLGRRKW